MLRIWNLTVTTRCSCRQVRSVTVDAVTTREVRQRDSGLGLRCAAVASIGAAVIHFAVAPMHWRDWVPSGVFFASIAVFQLTWGFLAWSRSAPLVLVAGVVGNAGSAALWVMSRTAGPPFGPSAGQPEAVEAAGICVLLLQCYVIMGAAWALLRRHRADQGPAFGRALVLVGANAVMVGAVTVGLASGLQGHHHHGGATEAEAEHEAAHDVPHAPAVPEPARPVTDMGLVTDGHQHHHGD